MALEQMNAFFDERDQESLGPFGRVGPDGFPLLESSELKAEHAFLTEMLELPRNELDLGKGRARSRVEEMVNADKEQRTRYYLAMLERTFSFDSGLSILEDGNANWHAFGEIRQSLVLEKLFEKGVDVDQVLLPSLRWIAARRWIWWEATLLQRLLSEASFLYPDGVPPELRRTLMELLVFGHDSRRPEGLPLALSYLDDLLGKGVWNAVLAGEIWTDRIIDEVGSMPEDRREAWTNLLTFLATAKASKPSAKWTQQLQPLLDAVGRDEYRARVLDWTDSLDKGRTLPSMIRSFENTDTRQTILPRNADTLRGMLWALVPDANAEVCRALGRVGLSGYRKVRGVGPRAVKVGNTAVYCLGEIGSSDALAQLAILKVRVKFGTAQKGIGKALDATAERVGISREDLEEMSVPAYGLTEVGLARQTLGEFTAELVVSGTKCELKWSDSKGKARKTVPSAVKSDYAEDLKELKQSGKDIDKMLPAQVARIEQLYLQQKAWKYPVWRERYCDHPLVGSIARRLVWRFTNEDHVTSAMWTEDGFVDPEGQPVEWIDPTTTVSLWHPLDDPSETTAAWRERLETAQIRQPFKQAHREIYLLTDAERNTEIYSNRFAAHILKQHQFNALCATRGWKNQLRLAVDASYHPAHIVLPQWNLRAEFWIDSVGDEYGVDTNESGTYHYVATDQVRFYRTGSAMNWNHASGGRYASEGTDEESNHPLALETIPAFVFSEVLRDVDLFVGVASVANDPTWSDGGPEGRYRDYWESRSFGDLGATAQTRKAVLERIIPRLKIADRCSFSERFLVVRGELRTYKIHLGSGNILMEPNDQYLCIVPKQSISKLKSDMFLPFEGDGMLSVVLSKALMLAADTKIKDTTITSQIGGR